MNLYLLITAKKQIFAYFQYLVCLNKILQSLDFLIANREKKIRGKVTKFFQSDYIFPQLNFNPILSNPDFLFLDYHVSFNLMSRGIDIISADVSIFDDLAIFIMSKDFLNLQLFVTSLLGLALNILAMLSI